MDKTDVIRLHALELAAHSYYAPGQVRIYLKKDGYCYATDPGADFRQFEYACISDITAKADVLKDVLMASKGIEALVAASTPYASICAASGRDIWASMDDMAQLIGPRVVAVPGTFRSVQKALRRVGAVMISGGEPCVITAGKTLSEACAVLNVLEKSAEVNLKAAVLGGRKPLGKLRCRLQRTAFRRSHPRLQETGSGMMDVEDGAQDAATLLLEYGKRLLEDGLVQGSEGNMSVRLDQEYMLCTPSGIDYHSLAPEDMVKVRISDGSYEGERKPTSEMRLHAGIYAGRPDAGAVIHTHAKYCSVFAAAEMPLQVENPEHREQLGDLIRISRYARPGTRKLTARLLAALKDAPGALMAHHGMICCGATIEEAYRNCLLIEAAAASAIDRRLE